MSGDMQREAREPIGISVVVGAMMLVMLSHAAHSIFAWLGFAGALVGLVLINLRYRAVLRAQSAIGAADRSHGDEALR